MKRSTAGPGRATASRRSQTQTSSRWTPRRGPRGLASGRTPSTSAGRRTCCTTGPTSRRRRRPHYLLIRPPRRRHLHARTPAPAQVTATSGMGRTPALPISSSPAPPPRTTALLKLSRVCSVMATTPTCGSRPSSQATSNAFSKPMVAASSQVPLTELATSPVCRHRPPHYLLMRPPRRRRLFRRRPRSRRRPRRPQRRRRLPRPRLPCPPRRSSTSLPPSARHPLSRSASMSSIARLGEQGRAPSTLTTRRSSARSRAPPTRPAIRASTSRMS